MGNELPTDKHTAVTRRGSESPLREGDQDEFKFDDYSALLAQRLVKEDPPFTLGIFGRWGSGKTSLMRRIKYELPHYYLAQDDNSDAVLAIWFNAWKYDREEAIWRALLVHTLKALQDYLLDERQEDGKTVVRPRFEAYQQHDKTLEQLQNIKTSLYRTVEQKQKGQVEIDISKFAKGAVKLGLPMLTGGLLSGGFLEQLFKSKDADNVNSITQMLDAFHRTEQTQYFEKIQFLNDFHERFEGVISGLVTSEQLPLQKIVFFIDDLDRCLPDKAIQVFEAIKLFLDNRYCVFVVGVDEQAIQAGIECRYQNFFSHYSSSGADASREEQNSEQGSSSAAQQLHLRRLFKDEYLEKIIQLPFHLPEITRDRIEPFIGQRVQVPISDDKDTPHPKYPLLPGLLAVGVEPNPRKIKRLCYSINLIWGIVCRRNLSETLHPEIIAKLLLIQQRDQTLYQAIQSNPLLLRFLELYWKFEEDMAQQRKTLASTGAADSQDRESIDKQSGASTPGENPYRSYAKQAQQFYWVKDLLQWPPTASDDQIATFAQLGKSVVNYLSLTASAKTESTETMAEHVVTRLDEKVLKDLLNTDITIIERAANSIGEEALADYQRYLLAILNNPEHAWRERVSAGDALGFVGDPRFDKPCWENPGYWIAIKEGDFFRGSVAGEEGAKKNEFDGKAHPMDAFEIARYPVTNADYYRFVTGNEKKIDIPDHWSGGKYPQGSENHPVVQVSWHDAQAYIDWLNRQQRSYRYILPSEAQWERAARGPARLVGQENRRRYPWGNAFDSDKYQCNVKETGLGRTSAVGCFPDGASPEGAVDMAGNVWEWCADWYDENYYQQGSVDENTTKGNDWKVVRGGSFDDSGSFARCVCRRYYHPDYGFRSLGFRVARIVRP